MIARICEEFGCVPSVAVTEPLDLCLSIIEDRAYVRAKQQVEQAKNMDDLPKDDPMIDLVQEIQFDIAREVRERRLRHRQ